MLIHHKKKTCINYTKDGVIADVASQFTQNKLISSCEIAFAGCHHPLKNLRIGGPKSKGVMDGSDSD